MTDKQSTILEMWPILKDDLELFIADRPGWLINALKKAREKRGSRGWSDIETIEHILQFLKDTEVEY